MSEETVTIPKTEYESLQKEAKFLEALRAAGVDNWEGWDYAIDILNED
jgi:hypothetical protein